MIIECYIGRENFHHAPDFELIRGDQPMPRNGEYVWYDHRYYKITAIVWISPIKVFYHVHHAKWME